MSGLSTMLEAIAKAVGDATGLKTYVHEGEFTDTDTKRFMAEAPCIYVSCAGVSELEDYGDDLLTPGQWLLTVVVKRTSGEQARASRIDAALVVVEKLLAVIRDSNAQGGAWTNFSSSAPSKLRARNTFGRGVDVKGLSTWLVTWEQSATLKPWSDEKLADLLRINTTFNLGGPDPDEPNTSSVMTTLRPDE